MWIPTGFVVRGTRKLALARAAGLDLRGFTDAAKTANRLIEQHGVYDQRRFPLTIFRKSK